MSKKIDYVDMFTIRQYRFVLKLYNFNTQKKNDYADMFIIRQYRFVLII